MNITNKLAKIILVTVSTLTMVSFMMPTHAANFAGKTIELPD